MGERLLTIFEKVQRIVIRVSQSRMEIEYFIGHHVSLCLEELYNTKSQAGNEVDGFTVKVTTITRLLVTWTT